jgi:hypothetical protein
MLPLCYACVWQTVGQDRAHVLQIDTLTQADHGRALDTAPDVTHGG